MLRCNWLRWRVAATVLCASHQARAPWHTGAFATFIPITSTDIATSPACGFTALAALVLASLATIILCAPWLLLALPLIRSWLCQGQVSHSVFGKPPCHPPRSIAWKKAG
jgi:hypothetical protein